MFDGLYCGTLGRYIGLVANDQFVSCFDPRRGASRNARVDTELEEVFGSGTTQINDTGSGVKAT